MSSKSVDDYLSKTGKIMVQFSVEKNDWNALNAYFQECWAHKEDESAEPFFWYLIDCAMGRNGSDESRLIGELMTRYCSRFNAVD